MWLPASSCIVSTTTTLASSLLRQASTEAMLTCGQSCQVSTAMLPYYLSNKVDLREVYACNLTLTHEAMLYSMTCSC